MQEINSQSANEVIKRLKSLLKLKTDIELSELLNVRPNTISTWKKRNSLDYETIISICELYELNLNLLFLNKNSMSASLTETPYISRDVNYQYASGIDRENLMEIVPKYSFPFITSENSLAYQVIGNNMYPLLVENTIVLCEEVALDCIKENQIAVIATFNKGIFLNRISKSRFGKDEYILTSESNFYADVNLSAKEIKECWFVRGELSYDVNTESRFQYIYDSLKKINKFFHEKKFSLD